MTMIKIIRPPRQVPSFWHRKYAEPCKHVLGTFAHPPRGRETAYIRTQPIGGYPPYIWPVPSGMVTTRSYFCGLEFANWFSEKPYLHGNQHPRYLMTPRSPRPDLGRNIKGVRRMTRWNREAIIAVLQKVYQGHGYCTSYQWMRDRRSPHFYTIIHFFGSWHAAWQAAGYDVPHRLAPKDRIVTRDLVVQ